MTKRELKQIIKECVDEIIQENNSNLDISKLTDVEVGNINRDDFPDFVDAYIVSASYPIVDNPKNPEDYRELSDGELEWLNNAHPEIAQDKARENFQQSGHEPYDEAKKKKWIQTAVNPKHKGFCSPMTKATCTPHRKALAMRFKKGI